MHTAALLLLLVCCALAIDLPLVEWRAADWTEDRWPSSDGGTTLVRAAEHNHEHGHPEKHDDDDDDGSLCWAPIEALLSGYNQSLLAQLRSAGALSIELVVKAQRNHSHDSVPTGSYSRIFGISSDVLCPSTLDTSIGQRGNNIVWRLRTNRPSTRCDDFELVCHAIDDLTTAPHSMVFVFDGYSMSIYKDGVQCATAGGPSRFDLSTWDTGYPFVVGDELSMDRSWKGLLNRISVWGAAVQPRPFAGCGSDSPATPTNAPTPLPTTSAPTLSPTNSPIHSATSAPGRPTVSSPTTTAPVPTSSAPTSGDNVTLPLGGCMSNADCPSPDACHPASCVGGSCQTGLLQPGCCLYDGDCPPSSPCVVGRCNEQTMTCAYVHSDVFCCTVAQTCPPRRCYVASCNNDSRCAYARNETLFDRCGVCGGDGQSCVGCDGVANSGVVADVCGVCGGDGSSCTLMNRELFGVFWFAFALALTLLLLYRSLPVLVVGGARLRRRPV